MPFGRKGEYAKAVAAADLERLARLVKVCGFLPSDEGLYFLSPHN
ncbi:MAG: hypothetical protein ACPLYF_03005 [Fervidobacterium sp.]